ncbi:hypothetical protein NDU88_004813 [Pleurodeles waltl]|uniref:Uncharacterized protein n=1 Tax=Pleurodeles waltl TaxID=8319 RepID=A0AAV7UK60_PLEWA|nr:hypothetical protein NDU88_004813 [Pleurodeles waltl]
MDSNTSKLRDGGWDPLSGIAAHRAGCPASGSSRRRSAASSFFGGTVAQYTKRCRPRLRYLACSLGGVCHERQAFLALYEGSGVVFAPERFSGFSHSQSRSHNETYNPSFMLLSLYVCLTHRRK